MPFNINKCEVIIFNGGCNRLPNYIISGAPLRCVQETKDLSVTILLDLIFISISLPRESVQAKYWGASNVLYDAPERMKLHAYTSLSRPVFEYAATLWYPFDNQSSYAIELVAKLELGQPMKNIKGRQGIAEARYQLGPTATQRKKRKQTFPIDENKPTLWWRTTRSPILCLWWNPTWPNKPWPLEPPSRVIPGLPYVSTADREREGGLDGGREGEKMSSLNALMSGVLYPTLAWDDERSNSFLPRTVRDMKTTQYLPTKQLFAVTLPLVISD